MTCQPAIMSRYDRNFAGEVLTGFSFTNGKGPLASLEAL